LHENVSLAETPLQEAAGETSRTASGSAVTGRETGTDETLAALRLVADGRHMTSRLIFFLARCAQEARALHRSVQEPERLG